MGTDSLNRALNSIFKCLLFFQTLLNPASKGIYNVNEGAKVPRVKIYRPKQSEVTFPKNNTASTSLVPKGMVDNPRLPNIHTELTSLAPAGF